MSALGVDARLAGGSETDCAYRVTASDQTGAFFVRHSPYEFDAHRAAVVGGEDLEVSGHRAYALVDAAFGTRLFVSLRRGGVLVLELLFIDLGVTGETAALVDLARRAIGRITIALPPPMPVPTSHEHTPEPSASPVTAVRALVERLDAEPFGDDNIDAAIDLLARSGIGTYEAPTAAEPMIAVHGVPSPMALLHGQVRAIALEAWAGGGIPGEELDPLVATAPDLVPASYVLAGYVAAVDTEGHRSPVPDG
jgi:hypothetical protein